MNDTIRKFGWSATLIREYQHWVILLRPAQPTLGSLVLAAKSDATSFGDIPPEAHAELSVITKTLETALHKAVDYSRINYLMLMMVDPHVHFHILPRYDGTRSAAGLTLPDAGWPGQPNLASAVALDDAQRDALMNWLKPYFA